jgi:hypothetical protein
LGGVRVACNGTETITLADGTYRLDNLEPSTYVVTAATRGFEPDRKEVTVTEGTVTVDFYLKEAIGKGTIRGRIIDVTSGKPISSGGTVILILPLANKYASVSGDGSYEFRDLPADNYELWASVPSYEDTKETITLGEGETKTLDFRCVPSNRSEPPWG